LKESLLETIRVCHHFVKDLSYQLSIKAHRTSFGDARAQYLSLSSFVSERGVVRVFYPNDLLREFAALRQEGQ
jgi:hypothetical protein